MDKATLSFGEKKPPEKASLEVSASVPQAPPNKEVDHMTALAFLLQQIETKQRNHHDRAKEMMELNHKYRQDKNAWSM